VFGKYLGEGTSLQEGSSFLLPSQKKEKFGSVAKAPGREGQLSMRNQQKGFSLIELLIVVAIILIIAAIAIPNLIASRERANEAAAVEALRTLSESQASYNITYGQTTGYAASLAALGPGDGTACNQTQACLIDAQLGCTAQPCARGGFQYFMVSDFSSPPIQDYSFTATPLSWNQSGAKNFCAVEDGIIRYQIGGTASIAAVPHNTCMNFAVYGSIQ
jgi:type IV pilus assembly protein PilA